MVSINAISGTEIKAKIREYISEKAKIDSTKIKDDVTFDNYGIDSVLAVHLTAELSELLEREISPTLLYEYQTVNALADYLEAGGE